MFFFVRSIFPLLLPPFFTECLQQLCMDTGCSLEDMLNAMDDKDEF